MKDSNKIILGTVQMGIPYGIHKGGGLAFSDSEKILFKAFSAGIEILDTAEVYGNAHKVIGKFHRNNPGLGFRIMTKLPKSIENGNIEQKIENYLEDLKVSELEAIMFHSLESFLLSESKLPELLELKKRGVIKNIGVSVYNNSEIEDILFCKEVDLVQIPFNLLDNYRLRGETFKAAKKKGKTIHTRSVFLQGLFFMDLDAEFPIVKKLKPQLKEIRKIAQEEGMNIASLALNYCLQEEMIDKVLIGVDSLDQLEQDLGFLKQHLTHSSIDKINNITIDEKELLNPSLWN